MTNIERLKSEGLKVGDVIRADSYFGPRISNTMTVKVTAIGETVILAKMVKYIKHSSRNDAGGNPETLDITSMMNLQEELYKLEDRYWEIIKQ